MNKTILIIGITILFIGMSFNSISGIQIDNNIIIPTNRGNTLYVGGNGSGNYSKIQDAIDNASDGDTVFVYDESSPYFEHLYIQKSISLIGEDKNTTIIQFQRYSAVINIYNDEVILKNFTIKNSDEDGYGIYITSKSNCIIGNIFKVGETGIYLDGSSDNIISQNSFVWSPIGIYLLENSNNNIISNNSFEHLSYCLIIGQEHPWNNYGTHNNKIEYNIIKNYIISGIEVIISKDIIISHNIISGELLLNARAITVRFSENIVISDNVIEYNEDVINIYFSDTIVIKRNYLYSNGCKYSNSAIYIEETNNNKIISNNISKNKGYGIYFVFCRNNKIYYNNFVNNIDDVYFSNTFFSDWNGNYWNESRTSPKILYGTFGVSKDWKWINIDWYPAKEPYDITNPQSYDI